MAIIISIEWSLEAIWSTKGAGNARVCVIVCGSCVSWILNPLPRHPSLPAPSWPRADPPPAPHTPHPHPCARDTAVDVPNEIKGS